MWGVQDGAVETASQILTKGQEVEVRVIDVNKLKGRVSLSLKTSVSAML